MSKIKSIINTISQKIQPLTSKVKTIFTKNKKKILVVGIVVVAFAAGFFFKGLFVVALVNGQPITRLKVIQELELKGGTAITDSLINETLVKQELAKRKITVDKTEVDKYISQVEATVKAQNQNYDEALAAQGYTKSSFRKSVELNMGIQKMLGDKATATDADVQAYIDANKESLKESLPTDADIENAKPIIKSQLSQQELSDAVQSLITELKKNAKITFFVKY